MIYKLSKVNNNNKNLMNINRYFKNNSKIIKKKLILNFIEIQKYENHI